MTHVLLAGGGTAGHVEPALAVADALRRRRPDIDITFLGTTSGLEASLVPARHYALEFIPKVPLPRKISADLVTLPWRMTLAIRRVQQVMKQTGADVLIGFGGYVALPAYLAARGRIPILIHEANAKPGLANRVGASFATTVAEAVPGSLPRATHVGVPLKQSIAHSTYDKFAARRELGLTPERPTLLVIGGSQGARRINAALAVAGADLIQQGYQVLHGVGRLNHDDLVTLSGLGQHYVAKPYLDNMAAAYAAADVILCRSGAMTCAEVAVSGVPAVFVPYPVGNGEQRLNALPLVQAGAAVLIDDADFSAATVTSVVAPLLQDQARRADMSDAMRAMGMPNADERIVDLVDKMLESGAPR